MAASECRIACIYKGFSVTRVLERLEVQWEYDWEQEPCDCATISASGIAFNQRGPAAAGFETYKLSARLQGELGNESWSARLFPVVEANQVPDSHLHCFTAAEHWEHRQLFVIRLLSTQVLMELSVGPLSCTFLYKVEQGSFLGLPVAGLIDSSIVAVRSPSSRSSTSSQRLHALLQTRPMLQVCITADLCTTVTLPKCYTVRTSPPQNKQTTGHLKRRALLIKERAEARGRRRRSSALTRSCLWGVGRRASWRRR